MSLHARYRQSQSPTAQNDHSAQHERASDSDVHAGVNNIDNDEDSDIDSIISTIPGSTSIAYNAPHRHMEPEEASLTACIESLSFEGMNSRQERIKEPFPGTCHWLLQHQEYHKWKQADQSLLFIRGKPGSGKSTLLSYLKSKIDDTDTSCILYFFFNAQGKSLEFSQEGFLRSILHQLLQADKELNDSINSTSARHQFSEKIQFLKEGRQCQWQAAELERLIESLLWPLATEKQLYLFVDALDEIGNSKARKVAQYLSDLHKMSRKQRVRLRICLSHRRWPGVFVADIAQEIIVELENSADIINFVNKRLRESGMTAKHFDNIKDILISHANGVFQWVFIATSRIISSFHSGMTSNHILLRFLDNLPADLFDMYQRLIDTISSDEQAESIRLFQWICYSARPLKPEELRYILALDYENPAVSLEKLKTSNSFISDEGQLTITHPLLERLNSLSRGLAEVSRDSIQLVHQTVFQYLITGGIKYLGGFTSNSVSLDSHWQISRNCLYYLSLCLTEDISSKETFRKTLKENAFLLYALQFWLFHVREAEFKNEQINQNDLIILLDDRLCRKLEEAYHYMKNVPAKIFKSEDWTLCHLAASQNLHSLLRGLIYSRPSDINRPTAQGETPLAFAFQNGDLRAVDMLLGTGRATIEDDAYNKILQLAAAEADEKTVRLRPDMHGRTNIGVSRVSAAFLSVLDQGHENIMRLLLEGTTDADLPVDMIRGFMYIASYEDKKKAVRLLLSKGADIDAQGGQHGNALQAASYQGHEQMVQLLLSNGANVNAQGGWYGNALQAASHQGYEQIAQLLLSKGADINAQGGQYGNALQAAALKAPEQTVQLLISNGADINAQGGQYGHALQAASYEGHEDTVRLLLSNGADVNAQGGRFGNAFQAASYRDHEFIKQLISTYGAHPDANADKNTLESGRASSKSGLVSLHADSGYVSLAKRRPQNIEQSTDGMPNKGYNLAATPGIRNDDNIPDDISITHSLSMSVAARLRSDFISWLVEKLDKDAFAVTSNIQHKEQVISSFSGLLTAFAFKIGSDVEIREGRQIMAQTIRWEREISEELRNVLLEQCSRESSANPMEITAEISSHYTSDWVRNNDAGSPPIDEHSFIDNDLRDNISGSTEQATDRNYEHKEREENEQTTPVSEEFSHYADILVQTDAFQWLIESIKRELLLTKTECTAREVLSRTIRRVSPQHSHISRTLPPQPYRASFKFDWEIIEFLKVQNYGCEPEQAVMTAFVLVGNETDAQACSCTEYMTQTWPLTGIVTLRTISRLVQEPSKISKGKWFDGTIAEFELLQSKLISRIEGTADSVAEAAEQLLWLTSALRLSNQAQGVAICSPVMRLNTTVNNENTLDISFSFPITPANITGEYEGGACWHQMFRNPVLVKGFPIPRRPTKMKGLQISLQNAASLMKARSIHRLGGETYVKTFTSLLYPTEVQENYILWHFQYSDTWISYDGGTSEQCEDMSLNHVLQSVHVIGWSPKVKYNAGAKNANYKVKRSTLPRPAPGYSLDKASISISRIFGANITTSLGLKSGPVRTFARSYLENLDLIKDRVFVFWDEGEKRAWLINGLSAVLHVVRGRLRYLLKNDLYEGFLKFTDDSVQEASKSHGPRSAIEVFRSNLNLQLYDSERTLETKITTKIDSDNRPQEESRPDSVMEDKQEIKTFKDLTKDILEIFGDLIWYQDKSAERDGLYIEPSIRQNFVGWSFRDLTDPSIAIYPRRAKLPKRGYGWVDFIRKVKAVVIFGSNFGELIEPYDNCKRWSLLPKGQSYLAATTYDLRNVMRHHGDKNVTPPRLCDDLLWHSPNNPFGVCCCDSDKHENHTDYIQTIVPDSFRIDIMKDQNFKLEKDGAIIFGRTRLCPIRYLKSGNPFNKTRQLRADNSRDSSDSSDTDEAEVSNTPRISDQTLSATVPSSQTSYDDAGQVQGTSLGHESPSNTSQERRQTSAKRKQPASRRVDKWTSKFKIPRR